MMSMLHSKMMIRQRLVFNSPGLDGYFSPACKLLGPLVPVVSQGVIRVWFIRLDG